MGRMMRADLPELLPSLRLSEMPVVSWRGGLGGGVTADISDYPLALLSTLQISGSSLTRTSLHNTVWSLDLTYNPYFDKKRKELLELFFHKGPNQVGVLTLTLKTNLEAQSIFAFILSFDILRELEYLQWQFELNKNSFYSYIIDPDCATSARVSAFAQ